MIPNLSTFLPLFLLITIFPNFTLTQSTFTNLSTTLTTANAMPTSTQAEIDSLITTLKAVTLSPLRQTYFEESCMSSHQCRFGTCNLQYYYCECDTGYSLNNCEYTAAETAQFASISSKFVTFIDTTYPLAVINATPTEDQLQRICTSVRQAFKVPDAVPQADADKIQATLLAVMDKAGTLTNVVPRLQLMEAISYTVQAYYVKLRTYRENYVKSQATVDLNTYTSKKAAIQTKISALLTKMQSTLLPQIGSALTAAETTFKVRTNLFTAQVALTSSTNIISETRAVKYNGSMFVNYQIQSDLLGNPVPAAFDVLEQIIEYYAHPKEIGVLSDSIFEESLFSRYSLYKPDKTAVTLSATGNMIYKIPLSTPSIFRNSDVMSCYQWDGTTQGDCFTLNVSASSIVCSCRGSAGNLVYGQLRTNKYEHVTGALKGVYTDYDGYKYWEKSLGFLFTISLVSFFLLLYPFFYFGEKKRLARIKEKIKIELQQLDKPGAREFDNQFKSVVALDQSKDSNFEDSIDKGYLTKKINRSEITSNSKKAKAQIVPLDASSSKKSQSKKILGASLANGKSDLQEDKGRKSINFDSDGPNKLEVASSKNINNFNQSTSTKPSGKNFDFDKNYDNEQGDDPKIPSEQLQEFDRTKEIKEFTFWNQLRGASPFLNICYIDSILMPRHVRLTILFLQLLISVFACSVYYNTIHSPINVQQEYYVLGEFKTSYIMISFFAPLFADIAMYFFAEIFRLSKSRFKNVQTVDDYKLMMSQLDKQILLRYSMAYFIVGSGVTAAMWYIIKFSSSYGWQISSGMFYSSIIAWGVDFVVYELIMTIFVFLMYKCWRKFAVFLDKVRKFKQATSEEEK